ncbi:MAG: DUF1573 domain-containing protein [Bacteroidales bacterium]|nr:DUF1573 domain-containing protein [Bacteroidales bacterium]
MKQKKSRTKSNTTFVLKNRKANIAITAFIALQFFILPAILFSQETGPIIKFESPIHKFGNINEVDGKVTHKFIFENVGDDTLLIKRVKPGCGCTSSNWTKTPVLPGEQGFISATFNPANRKGKFTKGISITTNELKNPNKSLIIEGHIIPRPPSFKDTFRIQLGNLWVTKNSFSFMNIMNTQKIWDTVLVFNNNDKAMTLSIKQPLLPHIEVAVSSEVLQPKQRGFIAVGYDAVKKGGLGPFYGENIRLNTNDSIQPLKIFHVAADIKEDFSHLTDEERAKSPKIVFENPTFDFGTAKTGDVVKHTFSFTNQGLSDLIIHRTQAACSCTATMPTKKNLKPGESAEIALQFNTSGRKGKQVKTITVITNDYANPKTVLTIKGNLEN